MCGRHASEVERVSISEGERPGRRQKDRPEGRGESRIASSVTQAGAECDFIPLCLFLYSRLSGCL